MDTKQLRRVFGSIAAGIVATIVAAYIDTLDIDPIWTAIGIGVAVAAALYFGQRAHG